jgi:hypothetical protein
MYQRTISRRPLAGQGPTDRSLITVASLITGFEVWTVQR